MLECAILGDSIAVGISLHLKNCHRQAIGGVSSQKYEQYYTKRIGANHVIISLGSNDKILTDYIILEKIRKRVSEAKVTWILSYNNENSREIIRKIAKNYGDSLLEIKETKDTIHPTTKEYKRLADEWQRGWKKK